MKSRKSHICEAGTVAKKVLPFHFIWINELISQLIILADSKLNLI